ANAALSSLKPRFAVDAHLEKLFAPERPQEQRGDVDTLQSEASMLEGSAPRAERPQSEEQGVPVKREQKTAPAQLHPSLDEALREELTKVNSQRHDWIERVGEPNREMTHATYQRLADFQVSTTDPDASVMKTKGGGSHVGYHTHDIVDGEKFSS